MELFKKIIGFFSTKSKNKSRKSDRIMKNGKKQGKDFELKDGIKISKNFEIDKNCTKIYDMKKNMLYDYSSSIGRIKAYDDRLKHWFFSIVEKIEKTDKETHNRSGIILLILSATYLETTQQFIEGKNSNWESEKFFKRGLKRILPKKQYDDDIGDKFWKGVRCGLSHSLLIKENVKITHKIKNILKFNKKTKELIINPFKLFKKIEKDHKKYIKELRTNKKKINNFDKFWENSGGFGQKQTPIKIK